MSMPDPQPMDPALLDELQDDIKERRCGVAYGMALALQDLSTAHNYWQARAARMERERDEARRAVCRLEAKGRRTVPASMAEAHGWGYLYPESEACPACGRTEGHKMSCRPLMREGGP